MNRSRIEWTDYTVNPVKGICPVHCRDLQGKEYCYAASPTGLYKRFHWDEAIRYDNSLCNEAPKIAKPSRIFVGSTMELFGPWVDPEWLRLTLNAVKAHPQHTFIFLTKRPQELARYNPWPQNCWVGASAPTYEAVGRAYTGLLAVQAKVRFASFEPLLEEVDGPALHLLMGQLDWAIVGQRTPVREPIPRHLVDDIVWVADNAGVRVFLKDNLRPLLGETLRQEWPE